MSMWKVATTAGVLSALGLLAACGEDPDPAVQGSGTVVADERAVSGFREIELRGSGEVIIDVGGTESLTVEADDNLLPLISTNVRDARLVIEHDGSFAPTEDIVYRIDAIEVVGLSVTGSGNVVAPNLDCDAFSLLVAGAGSFDLGGECDLLGVDIAGSGDVDAEDLHVSQADVTIAGSGDVVVNVSDHLEVVIAGSGDVVYIGDPTTAIDIGGTGDVRQRS